MACSVRTAILMTLTVAACAATDAPQEGGPCMLATIPGTWTPFVGCTNAQDFVHVPMHLIYKYGHSDILVCCGQQSITPPSLSDGQCKGNGHMVYEVNLIADNESGGHRLPVYETKGRCVIPPKKEGEPCTIATGDRPGVWTYNTVYCTENSPDGCCRAKRPHWKIHPHTSGIISVELFEEPQQSIANCSGVLVAETAVLTTATCVNDFDVRFVRIASRYATPLIEVDTATVHPEHDVGVLRLYTAVVLPKTVRMACLPRGDDFDSGSLLAAGFPRDSSRVFVTNITATENGKCEEQPMAEEYELADAYNVTGVFCGGRNEESPCLIKSGAALFDRRGRDDNCHSTLVGLAGTQFDCRSIGFVRLSGVVAWIEESLANGEEVTTESVPATTEVSTEPDFGNTVAQSD